MTVEFARTVGKCMKAKGLTPNDAARKTGIRGDRFEGILDGTRNPSVRQVSRMIKIFAIPENEQEEFEYLAAGLLPAERDQAMAVRKNAIAIHSDGRVFARFPKPQGANDIAA